jgi:putative colanic acid biosynthesis UDP-glucose lipid carrier transferase
MEVTLLQDAPLIVQGKRSTSYRHYIADKWTYFLLKRIIDMVLSVLMILVVFSWLLPLLALWVKLDSRGPVFFLQKRVGKGGRSFTCYKFRTMVLNEEADEKQAEENDSRITRAGHWLRKTNLDEFPQFVNVLLGQMSIVGPRPHMHADCRQFARMIPHYKLRNMVKPGITGLAQVNGFHGPAMDYEAISRRYQWDIFYLRNASTWLDVKIMARTFLQRIRLRLPAATKQSWADLAAGKHPGSC